jgi:hypothetical protein
MKISEVVDAEVEIKNFATLQESLCKALFLKHGPAADEFLTNIPRLGLLPFNEETWEFRKHGVGVRFVNLANGIVVDAHTFPHRYPRCFDLWRLEQYFDSKLIYRLNVRSLLFDTANEESLSAMLAELIRLNKITKEAEGQLYRSV